MKLSTHFSLEEFCASDYADRYGIKNIPDDKTIEHLKEVAKQLEFIRNTLGELPIGISSGYRCLALNRGIGSSDSSGHVLGWACDFTCRAYGTPRDVAEKILSAGYKFDQLILEGVSSSKPDGAWVHISFDPKMRGDVMTAKFVAGKAMYTKGLNK